MCKINCDVEEGLIPSEKLVRVLTADGRSEEVFVSHRQVQVSTRSSVGASVQGKLLAAEIGRKDNRVLVELPRESMSGRWRLWINEDQIEG